jgi:DNA-binding transcriptional LysR family regulator
MVSSMDFRHVEAFVSVADEFSLRRAARRLGVSQPTLSRRVQQLEQELGLTLFVRHPDGIELTHHGMLMLDQARRLVAAATQLTDNVHTPEWQRRPAVRLGVSWGLWEAVHRICSRHTVRAPGVAVVGEDLHSSAQSEALRQGMIDVGLVRPPIDTRDLLCERLFDECVVAVLPASHPLAGRERLCVAELAAERLLLHGRELAPGIYDKIFELYGAAGITPDIVPTSASPANPGGLIQVVSGKGIYLGLGSLLALREMTGIAMVRIDDPRASLPVSVVWRAAESSPVVLQFIESIRRAFDGSGLPRKRALVATRSTTGGRNRPGRRFSG